jgi:hypothetical protein
MLKALCGTNFGPSASAMPIRTAQSLLYLPSSHIQIIEDLQPALDCASLLTSRNKVSMQTDWSAVGFALGVWLHMFHDWTQKPAQDDLRSAMGCNQASRDLKWRTTYSTIVSIAKMIPTVSEEELDVLQKVRARAERQHQPATHIPGDRDPEYFGLIHGDFWTGK